MENITLPIYRLLINDEEETQEIQFISLVDRPAFERNFQLFSAAKVQFSINEDKRILTGPAMLADTPVYRRDDQGEYYVIFDQDNVMKAAQRFFQRGYNQKFNLGHADKTDGVFVFESFITDEKKGIYPPKGFEGTPWGSWFISAKVNNSQVWADVKAGKYNGFSIEGFFGMDLKQPEKTEQTEEEILDFLKELARMLEGTGAEIITSGGVLS